jgi:hypothetical protein
MQIGAGMGVLGVGGGTEWRLCAAGEIQVYDAWAGGGGIYEGEIGWSEAGFLRGKRGWHEAGGGVGRSDGSGFRWAES